jgi:isocitrate/isopropylmalate dehydrogenase
MSPIAIPSTNGTTGQAPTGRPSYKIASIPGDGIGPEVISAGIKVLEKLAATINTFDLDFTHFEWSSKYYREHGRYLPDDALDQMKKFDAILFGAVGAPGRRISL